ncbi:Kinesin-associated protein 3 [Borealophlyctis nickersoniae]|nr:Kinesin-associated protein 3 [Borealophlyctis nickersoniae]
MQYLDKILPRLHRDYIKLLPADPVHRILSYIHPRDFCVAAQVSKPWLRALQDAQLWHKLYTRIGLSTLASANYAPDRSVKINARRIYNLANQAYGVLKHRKFRAHALGVLSLAFDGRVVATGSADNRCRVFDVRSGECVKELIGHEEGVYCIQIDDDKIITGSADATIKVWSLKDSALLATLGGHTETVTCLKINSNILISGSADRSCRIWHLNFAPETTAAGAPPALPLKSKGAAGTRGGSAKGSRSSPTAAGETTVSNKASLKTSCLRTLHGHTAGVKCLDFTPHVLISGDVHGLLRVWHVQSGNCLNTINGNALARSPDALSSPPMGAQIHDPISCMQYTGSRLVFGTFSGRLILCDMNPHPLLGGPTSTDYETLHKWATAKESIVVNHVFELGSGEKKGRGGGAGDGGILGDVKTSGISAASLGIISSDFGEKESQASSPGGIIITGMKVQGGTKPPLAGSAVTPTPTSTSRSIPAGPGHAGPRSWALCAQMDTWRLISGGGEGRCVVWNYRTGRRIYVLRGNTIDSGDGVVHVEEEGLSTEGEAGVEVSKGQTEETDKAVTGVAFDDRYTVIGSMDGFIRLWEATGAGDDSAIIVNYTVQAQILGENGQPVAGDRKAMQKIIRIKSLHANSNLAALAQEVVDKCKLISPSKVGDVEQTLYYLQQRQGGGGWESDRAWLQKQFDAHRIQDEPAPQQNEPPTMNNIEQYIEGLYEEIPDKIASTRNILQLARVPENMEALIGNGNHVVSRKYNTVFFSSNTSHPTCLDALMSALSRVLREDGKKSMELVTNIVYIFFCFSNFSQFHGFITANKVGDMCLRIADQELARFNLWVQDLGKLETKCAQNPRDTSLITELEQEHRKFQAMLRKQDQLLFVAFHLLLNLAEDLNIEVKMLKRDIVKYLVLMLDRKTPELLILVVTFLKKLSIFRENKDEMVKMAEQLLPKLDQLVPCEHPGLQNLTLRLLFNLSHDAQFRSILVKMGFLGKLVPLLNDKAHVIVTLQLLYQLSVDDKSKSSFSFTDVIPMIMRMILEPKTDSPTTIEVMALGINIASNPRNAEVMCDDNGLKFLMKRALKTRDPLLFKMVRNLSMHDGGIKMLFLDYIDDIMHVLFKPTTPPAILVELLGLLGNLTIPDFDFAKLAEAYNLIDFISRRLAAAVAGAGGSSGNSPEKEGGITEEDDITLEVVILLGTMGNDGDVAPMIARTNVLGLLIDLMIAKEEDDEIILQVIYCIYQFLLQGSTRTILLTRTQVVSYLIDLLYDRNVEIRKMCDICLDIIAEIDEEWVKKIRQQKFQWHNSEWLQLITQASLHGSEGFEESATLYSTHKLIDDWDGRKGRRGGITGLSVDSEDEDEEFGSSMMIGGNSALLDGP